MNWSNPTQRMTDLWHHNPTFLFEKIASFFALLSTSFAFKKESVQFQDVRAFIFYVVIKFNLQFASQTPSVLHIFFHWNHSSWEVYSNLLSFLFVFLWSHSDMQVVSDSHHSRSLVLFFMAYSSHSDSLQKCCSYCVVTVTPVPLVSPRQSSTAGANPVSCCIWKEAIGKAKLCPGVPARPNMARWGGVRTGSSQKKRNLNQQGWMSSHLDLIPLGDTQTLKNAFMKLRNKWRCGKEL